MRILIICAAAGACAACRGVPVSFPEVSPFLPAQEARVMEWKGQFSGVVESGHEVVGSAAQWQALWARIGQAAPAAPDFKSSFAAAVFLGQRNTGGYGIKWLESDSTGPAQVVRYEEMTPKGLAMQVLTQPFAVKVFPRLKADIKVEAAPH